MLEFEQLQSWNTLKIEKWIAYNIHICIQNYILQVKMRITKVVS